MQYKHFSIEEREIIQRRLWEKKSIRSIAGELGRSHTSVIRELKRNFPKEQKRYTPRLAHERALLKRSSRGRIQRLKNDRIRQYVIDHLRWSPEQIAGRIKIDLKERISHEAIYQFIYEAVKHIDLRSFLRRKRKRRIPKGARRCQRVLKPEGPSIDLRPKAVDHRKRIGDWEGDTVESCNHKPGVNTLVERRTGMAFVTKLSGKDGQATRQVLQKRLENVPKKYKRTLTLDNGPENRDWKLIEAEVGISCFFAHPYHSWERRTNENTNGLFREYFPKKTDFTIVPDAEIEQAEYALNTRPRKRLGFRTPLEVWSGAVRS